MAWLDVSDDLPIDPDVGQVLIFDFEGSPVYLKIMRIKDGKTWAKRLDPNKFLLPEEADEHVMVTPKPVKK